MSSNPIRLKYLLDKYLANACTRQELDEFWQLMAELSDNDLILKDLHDGWYNRQPVPPVQQEELNRVFSRLESRMEAHETPRKSRLLRMAYITSAAAVLLAAVFFGWQYLLPGPSTPLAAVIPAADSLRTVELPDGSRVLLNRASSLDYDTAFGGNKREVYLEGEAYFNIEQDRNRPFLVHTGNVVTTVLGTAFNIRSGENEVMVTVTAGSVQVQKIGQQETAAVLKPGDQVVVNRQAAVEKTHKTDVQDVMTWKNNDLFFDDIRFEDAAAFINRYYGVQLRFDNPALQNCRFTGDFSHKTIEQTMDIICDLTRSSWQRTATDVITLQGAGCPGS